ncbi:MAG TPA: hypothetical protein VF003_18620 [Pseudonocardiaceae bacterium]
MTASNARPVTPDRNPAEGAALLDAVHAALTRYVAMPTAQAADAVTLWIAATHAQPAWPTPRSW